MYEIAEYTSVNSLGTAVLLEALLEHPVRSMVVASSMSIYGEGSYVGADGATHAGSFDLSYLGCLPNMVIMAPSDEAELVHVVATAVSIGDRPSAFRYPRGEGTGVALPTVGEVMTLGKGRIMREGNNIAILAGDYLLATSSRLVETRPPSPAASTCW